MILLLYQSLVVFWIVIASIGAIQLYNTDNNFKALFWIFGILLMFMCIGASKAHADTLQCQNETFQGHYIGFINKHQYFQPLDSPKFYFDFKDCKLTIDLTS